jgi:hypothetical protein
MNTNLSALLAAVVAANDETYQAAVTAAQAELYRLAETVTVSVSEPDTDKPAEQGGSGNLYANYTVEVTVGEETHTVGGWVLCGWLKRGASADLDGSGLANWGSSQPGGWTTCDGDGACSGKIRVESDDSYCTITLRAGENHTDVELDVAELLGLSDDDAALVREYLRVPANMLAKIEGEIEGISLDVSEPTAEEIFDDLDSTRNEVEGLEGVRVGSFQGVEDYVFVAIKDDGDYSAQIIDDDDESLDTAITEHVERVARQAVRSAIKSAFRSRN